MQSGLYVVTGVAGRLGTAVANRLFSAGATVVGIDRAPIAPSPNLALALGGVDLADDEAVAAAFATVRERYDGIDGLVNVAGGFAWETVEGGSVATWDALFNMNVRSALLVSQAAGPLLAVRSGAIVNVGAAASQKAAAGMGAYAASKAGVSRLTEALAAEWMDRGVRVNAVLPSILDTPANRADMPDAAFERWVTPEDLSEIIAFLLSNASRAITGALIPVTGRV